MADNKQIKITLKRGLAGADQRQKDCVRTLGLHKIGQSTVREDTPIVRGVVRRIAHLVTVEEA
ncbi:50S ribosomal protein L30 [Scardovia inopinata]|uniref:Large ribosomal subunit protein uL30 n=1 Tax=Scardovia inopinata F0304 TaxID=641146 RepID=W5II67_SCAIO|nr:50S ribosomal protein L30 [Scardovia inopinata]EFG26679.1 ribosomal protein L30 [Scardovia inopinata F0304]BAR06276.1 50S ribosomal protein L30 [Scardovia inopinata JCM 12537]SUV51795.1 50S ribosomal protein L30 [Scardovia inopinata]